MKILRQIGVMAAVFGMLIAAGSTTPAPAHGASRRSVVNEQIRQAQAFEIGERNGYMQGLRAGRTDHRFSYRYNDRVGFPLHDTRWGYRTQYRYEDDYRRGFRRGYVAGYRAGRR